jgi:hypothetical protein
MASSATGSRVVNATSSAVSSIAGGIQSAGAASVNAVTSKVVTYETTTVLKLMRILNIVNAIGLMAAGVIMLIAVPLCNNTSGCPGPSTAIISFYLVVLGFLLFAFEARVGVMYEAFFRCVVVVVVVLTSLTNAVSRKYFGFMYGYWGRFFFILFLASMVVAIVNDQANLWFIVPIVAALTIANALLNCFIIRRHPGFQSGEAQSLAEQQRADAVLHQQQGRQQQQQHEPIARSNDFGADMPRPAYNNAPYGGRPPTSGGSDNPFAAVVV